MSALESKGPAYRARTHHLDDKGAPIYTNRLILETSPYLLQHAHNPVNWYPWGEEAFERAKRENKPVLMSVGYSTCHWCHVMERESFEDLAIAETLNRHYIAIKVDREERPDIDDVYMAAVQAMTGRGGWPMTVVMTPEQVPFFGGTYFPPKAGPRGQIGFPRVLEALHTAWVDQPDKVVAQAEELSAYLLRRSTPQPPGEIPTSSALVAASAHYASRFDAEWGGFGGAPKFPSPSDMVLLLRVARRSGDSDTGQMVVKTLKMMAEGGIYDHVGGGFHRYSTDQAWLVPHFEKMLYDQAQLVPLYLEAGQYSGDEVFFAVAEDILTYVARDMVAPEGGVYSATDADSPTPDGHEEEGWFFTWTPEEIRAVSPQHATAAIAWWNVQPQGNFEGRSILHTPRSRADVAQSLDLDPTALDAHIEAARRDLFASRETRPPPLRDDKVLTAWNGLMVSAFAKGALVLEDPKWAEKGRRTAQFLLDELRTDDGRLLRSWRQGRAAHPAILEDYAFLIQGLLDLHEATNELRWLDAALSLQKIQDQFYSAENGGYHQTASDAEALLTRELPTRDGAEPSGNSVSALNLLRLHELTGQQTYLDTVERLFSAFSVQMRRAGPASPLLMSALDFYLDTPRQIVIVGPDRTRLLEVVRKTYLPNRILLSTEEAGARAQESTLPLLQAKTPIDGQATAYVCERGLCEAPTTDPAVLATQLARIKPLVD